MTVKKKSEQVEIIPTRQWDLYVDPVWTFQSSLHSDPEDGSEYNKLALHYAWHLELSNLAYILVYYLQTLRNYKLFQVFTQF